MRQHRRTTASAGLAAIVVALALAGCSSSNPTASNATAGNATAGGVEHGTAGKAAPLAVPPQRVPGDAATTNSGSSGDTTGTATGGNAGLPSGGGTTQSTQARVLSAAEVQPSYQIRTANIDLTAKDPLGAKAHVVSIATAAGGFVFADDSTSDHGQASVDVTLKVPPTAYDGVVHRISTGVGTLRRVQQSTQDVTGQVIDVQSRLGVQRASIARLQTLLGSATDLGKIIQLESELTGREATLESMEAQLKALTDKTDLSTVEVTISEPGKQPKPKPVAGAVTVSDGFDGGAHAFVTFFRWLGIALGAVLPFAAAAAVIGAAVVLVRRRLHRSQPQEG